jgi:hypothetical protein
VSRETVDAALSRFMRQAAVRALRASNPRGEASRRKRQSRRL